jgi:hypothetical protein
MRAKISASAEILNYGRYIDYIVDRLEMDGPHLGVVDAPGGLAPDKISAFQRLDVYHIYYNK